MYGWPRGADNRHNDTIIIEARPSLALCQFVKNDYCPLAFEHFFFFFFPFSFCCCCCYYYCCCCCSCCYCCCCPSKNSVTWALTVSVHCSSQSKCFLYFLNEYNFLYPVFQYLPHTDMSPRLPSTKWTSRKVRFVKTNNSADLHPVKRTDENKAA